MPDPDSSAETGTLAERLTGISAVPPTPFSDDGRLDEAALRRVIGRVVDGAGVVVPCGNTGEHSSLTAHEAERVVAITIEAVDGRAAVIAGVGGDLPSATRLAAAAMDQGADGIMVHHLTHPFVSDAGLVAYYAAVAEAAGGPIVPYIRGDGLSDAVMRELLALPGVVAVKYAVPDVLAFARLVREYPVGVVWICGLAELWAPFFWLAGGRGFTSGLVTVMPELSRAMLDALCRDEPELAMRVHAAVSPFEQLRARHGNGNNVPVVKEALALLGIAGNMVRPPLARLSRQDVEELRSILGRWETGILG